MGKYVIKFEDNPWYQDDGVGYYKCGEIPWWSAKKSDIKKLAPLDKELDDAYQKGLDDGMARNENGCVGCKYENERIDHAPCIYCCNAYSNQWMAKEKSDEIKVGDEVCFVFAGGETIKPFIVFSIKDDNGKKYYEGIQVSDGRWVGGGLKYYKTGRHFPQVAELLEAMKGGAE